jgi:hypothetical protein
MFVFLRDCNESNKIGARRGRMLEQAKISVSGGRKQIALQRAIPKLKTRKNPSKAGGRVVSLHVCN